MHVGKTTKFKTMTNREIIEGIKGGNREAERIFYLQNKPKCTQYATQKFFLKSAQGGHIKCTQEEAEELYNDACMLLIQNVLRNRIKELDVQISTYLITSMRYFWMNKARAYKPKPEKQTATVSEPTIDIEAVRGHVRDAISRLDEKCREMMTYRYILGWEDYEDIAKVTGKSNGDVVRNLISRCRKRFREHYVQVAKFSDN